MMLVIMSNYYIVLGEKCKFNCSFCILDKDMTPNGAKIDAIKSFLDNVKLVKGDRVFCCGSEWLYFRKITERLLKSKAKLDLIVQGKLLFDKDNSWFFDALDFAECSHSIKVSTTYLDKNEFDELLLNHPELILSVLFRDIEKFGGVEYILNNFKGAICFYRLYDSFTDSEKHFLQSIIDFKLNSKRLLGHIAPIDSHELVHGKVVNKYPDFYTIKDSFVLNGDGYFPVPLKYNENTVLKKCKFCDYRYFGSVGCEFMFKNLTAKQEEYWNCDYCRKTLPLIKQYLKERRT